MNKISFICTTYRRYTCVNRIIAQFYSQIYQNKELIIFNTDIEYPLYLNFDDKSIIIINNDIDYLSKMPYKNRGQICRDAVTHATGEYFMLADDDDIYLPWHMQQAVDKIQEVGKDAWKPHKSFFKNGNNLMLAQNTLEASVIVKMNRIRELGFREDLTGYEGLTWYTALRDERQLDENYTNHIPSYCFNWSDPEIAGHKQSGDINNPDNFENHKKQSKDIAKDPLVNNFNISSIYEEYFLFIKNNINIFPYEMVNKYAKEYVI